MSSVNLSELLPPTEPGLEDKMKAIYGLLDAGFFLFPTCGINDGKGTCGRVGESLANAGKHPVRGAGIKSATRNKPAIEKYYSFDPHAGVGIYCRQSRLLVIDIDPRNDGDVSWEKFISTHSIELPETVEVATGLYAVRGQDLRGTHLYFRVSGDSQYLGSLSKFGLQGVDIKFNGYVVAPPSKHHSGVTYAFKPGLGLGEVPVADLPDKLEALLASSEAAGSGDIVRHPEGDLVFLATCSSETTSYGAAALARECSALALSAEGSRNNNLFKIGVRLSALVSGGEISFHDMDAKLKAAAYQSGLLEDEIESVLSRPGGAYELGARQPAQAPKASDALLEWADRHSVSSGTELSAEQLDFLKRANVVDLDHIFGEHEPELWFVPGFLCSGRGHALLSESGVGKSLLMREICAKLALGESIWNNPEQPPIRILYLDYENDPVFDIGASLKSMRLDNPDAYEGRLTFLSYPEIGYFDTAKGAADVEMALDMFEPDLVVIDTLSRVVEGEENSNDTWLKFYKSVGLVLKRRGQAYVRIDHLGKNTDKGARGGSAKSGDIDLIWTIFKRTGKNELFDIVNSKSRAYLEKKRFTIERRISPLEHVLIHTPEVDWDLVISNFEKYEQLMLWFAEQDAEGGFLGQKRMWSLHMETLQEMGVSLHFHNATHKDYKEQKEAASLASK